MNKKTISLEDFVKLAHTKGNTTKEYINTFIANSNINDIHEYGKEPIETIGIVYYRGYNLVLTKNIKVEDDTMFLIERMFSIHDVEEMFTFTKPISIEFISPDIIMDIVSKRRNLNSSEIIHKIVKNLEEGNKEFFINKKKVTLSPFAEKSNNMFDLKVDGIFITTVDKRDAIKDTCGFIKTNGLIILRNGFNVEYLRDGGLHMSDFNRDITLNFVNNMGSMDTKTIVLNHNSSIVFEKKYTSDRKTLVKVDVVGVHGNSEIVRISLDYHELKAMNGNVSKEYLIVLLTLIEVKHYGK